MSDGVASASLLSGYQSCSGNPQKDRRIDQFVATLARKTVGHAVGNILSTLSRGGGVGVEGLGSLAGPPSGA